MGTRGTGLALGGGMTRIAVAVLAVGIGGWLMPLAAQKAVKAPTATAFFRSRGGHTLRTSVRKVDDGALRMVATTAPGRVSWSTEHLTGLPARVSWTPTHTALASAFAVTLMIDAAQTRELARQGWHGFREANPLLGEHPSVGRVNSYTALAGVSVLGAAALAPPRVRTWLLAAALAVQVVTIGGSVRQGLPLRFP